MRFDANPCSRRQRFYRFRYRGRASACGHDRAMCRSSARRHGQSISRRGNGQVRPARRGGIGPGVLARCRQRRGRRGQRCRCPAAAARQRCLVGSLSHSRCAVRRLRDRGGPAGHPVIGGGCGGGGNRLRAVETRRRRKAHGAGSGLDRLASGRSSGCRWRRCGWYPGCWAFSAIRRSMRLSSRPLHKTRHWRSRWQPV